MTNNLKRAIDTDLSGLRVSERQRAEILDNALEGKKVKKKISVAFVMVMVLVLAAAVALAVATITEAGHLMAQTEKDNGLYEDWPVEKRVQIVTELMDEGCIPENAERKQLREGTLLQEDAARVADAAIAELTGEDVSEASFMTVMMAVWGPFENWTYEQQAWYSQVMEDVGYEVEGHTVYVVPTGEMTADDAVKIAKQEILRVFDMDASILDQYRVESSFQIPEDAEPGSKKSYWYVMFSTWNTGLKADELPFNAIDMFIDPDTGKLRDSLEEYAASIQAAKKRSQEPFWLALSAFEDEIAEPKNFMTWSFEHKARWSSEMAPLIKAYIAEHPDEGPEAMFTWYDLGPLDFVYGVPDDQAIAQTEALAKARDALRSAYCLSEEELGLLFDNGNPYYIKTYYDVTSPDKPLWKFFLEVPSIYGSDDALAARVKAVYPRKSGEKAYYDQFYKVELDAYTGEVVRTLNMRFMPDTLEGFKDCF